MRLLNTHNLKVQEFSASRRPPYAILSHTWGDDEVSFHDLKTSNATSMAGHSKITKCCETAIQDGFKYVWIDTCCIDKTSSAELSEAINSMYLWYQAADVCYAFLSDVHSNENPNIPESSFRHSRWFTRGWTLQELLAPETVVFYDSNWLEIGTKSELQEVISDITGISYKVLLNTSYIRTVSIATRMSWAARRQTTRLEDIAYSLMGIFGVHMPPLYGEGEKAFKRLQLEIIKDSNDESIFAWSDGTIETWGESGPYFHNVIGYRFGGSGLLADSPYFFRQSKEIMCNPRSESHPPFSMTNNGLHIWLPVIDRSNHGGEDICQAILNCDFAGGNGFFSIILGMDGRSGRSTRCSQNIYLVDRKHSVDFTTSGLYVQEAESQTLYQGQIPSNINRNPAIENVLFYFIKNDSPSTGYSISSAPSDNSTPAQSHGSHSGLATSPISLRRPRYTVPNKSYSIIQSRNDPSVSVMLSLEVLTSTDIMLSGSTRHCHIITKEEEIQGTYKRCCKQPYPNFGFDLRSPLENQKEPLFKPGEILDFIPNHKILKALPGSGRTIAITVRKGPHFTKKHFYNVHVAFIATPPTGVRLFSAAASLPPKVPGNFYIYST